MAGKSTELIRLVKRNVIANRDVLVFRHRFDNRYSDDPSVNTHDGIYISALEVTYAEQILDATNQYHQIHNRFPDTVAIDEIQFFEFTQTPGSLFTIHDAIKWLLNTGVDVIVAGLPSDFRNVPFSVTQHLLATCDEIVQLTGICAVCGKDGTRTQRIINGKPVKWDDPIVVVGGLEAYQCRCSSCHEVL